MTLGSFRTWSSHSYSVTKEKNGYFCQCHYAKIYFSGINDCSEAPQATGIYTAVNHGLQPFHVYCDQSTDSGGISHLLFIIVVSVP